MREQAPQIARARAIAVTKTAPSHRLQPGDLICGSCGEGNVPVRKFCSRCGSSLIEAATVAKLPWWRRIHLRRGPKVVKLGSERGKTAVGKPVSAHRFDIRHFFRQVYRKGRIVVAIAVVAAGAIYGVYPPFRTAVNSLFSAEKAKVTGIIDVHYPQVFPISCTATAQEPLHPASNVCENATNIYWLAAWSQQHEPVLTIKFQQPVTLTYLVLYSGAYGSYTADGRPAELTLTYSNHETDTFPTQDAQSQKPIRIHHGLQISSVQIRIDAIYAGQKNSANVAISSIQLYGLKK